MHLSLLPESRSKRLLSSDRCELISLNGGAQTHSRQPVWSGKDREGNNTDNDLNK